MSEEVVKFDPTKLYDAVKDKVRGVMFDAIPEEQWKTFITTEFNRFFLVKQDSYNRSNEISELGNIVRAVMKEETIKRLQETLNGPEYKAYWDKDKRAVGDTVKMLVEKHGADIFQQLMQNSVSAMVQNMYAPLSQQLTNVVDEIKRIRGGY